MDNTEISLQIWDTAGQERFRSMAPMYYRGAKAAICVFDVTSEESFNRVSTWVKDLKQHADPNVVICFAGNKCDKAPSFDLEKCEALASTLGGSFFRTSALTGEGVMEIFLSLSKRVAEVYTSGGTESKDYENLKLGISQEKNKSSCC